MNSNKSLFEALKTINRYKLELISAPLRLCKYSLGRPQSNSKNHFLIACMPKSGSTYFSSILECLPDMSRRDLCGGYGRREQELDPMRLILNHHVNYVGQLHIRCSTQTENLVDQFALKPVVLFRNIFDIVISLRDHFRKESLDWTSMGYAYEYMADWDDQELEFFLTSMFIPWYFNFFLTWKNSHIGYFESYENLTVDTHATVVRLFEHYNCDYSVSNITSAIEKVSKIDTRLNVGKKGRGNMLNNIAKNEILKMEKFYDEAFSILGL